jgi:hypothetical protein
MEGDTFEMEDHRNWTDASFKTYVRPLAEPWPYTLPAGQSFDQAVSLTFTRKLPKPKGRGGSKKIAVTLGGGAGTMPRIGVGVPGEADSAISAAVLRRRACSSLSAGSIAAGAYHRALPALRNSATPPAPRSAEIIDGTDRLTRNWRGRRPGEMAGLQLAAAVSPADRGHAARQRRAESGALTDSTQGGPFPGVRLGGGMFSYFTELNRKRPPVELLDYVTHTNAPIVHAADDISVMETLEALPYVIDSTRSFIGKKTPYWVGPSSIAARDNPYGAATAANPDNQRICLADRDPRHRMPGAA